MMRPMTPLSRDLHPSNGHRGPAISDDVVVPISAAYNTVSHARRNPGLYPGAAENAETMFLESSDHRQPDEPDEILPTEIHWEVLEMLSSGCADDIIAHRLNLDMCTFRGLISQMSNTLGACNRFQLALKAREHGWI